MVDVNAQMQAVERGVETTERHGQAVRVQRLAQEYPATIDDDVERGHDGAHRTLVPADQRRPRGSAAAISSRATPVAWCGNAAHPRTASRAITRRGSSAGT